MKKLVIHFFSRYVEKKCFVKSVIWKLVQISFSTIYRFAYTYHMELNICTRTIIFHLNSFFVCF